MFYKTLYQNAQQAQKTQVFGNQQNKSCLKDFRIAHIFIFLLNLSAMFYLCFKQHGTF